jgi:hypothetical protein
VFALFLLYSLTIATISRFYPSKIPVWLDPLGMLMFIIKPFQTLIELIIFVVVGFFLATMSALIFVLVVYSKADTIQAATPFLDNWLSLFTDSLTANSILKWVAGIGFLLILLEVGQQGFNSWDEYEQVKLEKEELYWYFYRFRAFFSFFEDLFITAVSLSMKYAVTFGLKLAVDLSCYWIIFTYGLEVFFLKQVELFDGVLAVGIAAAVVGLISPLILRAGSIFFDLKKHRKMVAFKSQFYALLLAKERES